MNIGYISFWESDEDYDKQLELLRKNDCETIITEDDCLNATLREQLLQALPQGCIVKVANFIQIGKNPAEALNFLEKVEQKKGRVDFLEVLEKNGIEDDNEQGKQLIYSMAAEMFHLLAQQEDLERQQKQRQGIERAKRNGLYTGRQRLYTADDPLLRTAFRLIRDGCSKRSAAMQTGIALSTLKRYVNEYYEQWENEENGA